MSNVHVRVNMECAVIESTDPIDIFEDITTPDSIHYLNRVVCDARLLAILGVTSFVKGTCPAVNDIVHLYGKYGVSTDKPAKYYQEFLNLLFKNKDTFMTPVLANKLRLIVKHTKANKIKFEDFSIDEIADIKEFLYNAAHRWSAEPVDYEVTENVETLIESLINGTQVNLTPVDDDGGKVLYYQTIIKPTLQMVVFGGSRYATNWLPNISENFIETIGSYLDYPIIDDHVCDVITGHFYFDAKQSPCVPFIASLSAKYHGVKFTITFVDELKSLCGINVFLDGQMVSETRDILNVEYGDDNEDGCIEEIISVEPEYAKSLTLGYC